MKPNKKNTAKRKKAGPARSLSVAGGSAPCALEIEFALREAEKANASAPLAILAAELKRMKAVVGQYEIAMTPRKWDRTHGDAWHLNIPDVHAAFAALRALPNTHGQTRSPNTGEARASGQQPKT